MKTSRTVRSEADTQIGLRPERPTRPMRVSNVVVRGRLGSERAGIRGAEPEREIESRTRRSERETRRMRISGIHRKSPRRDPDHHDEAEELDGSDTEVQRGEPSGN